MSGVPAEVRAMAEMSAMEDVVLWILRDRLPQMQVGSLIALQQTFPFILVRRSADFGEWDGDTRFMDSARVTVATMCEDPDGDEDAAVLAEVCRVVLRDAWLEGTTVPGRGSICRIEMTSAPRRVTDWATSTGPVQYADLPTGVWRYEIEFQVWVRKPRINPFAIP